jgi:hypothetical protein
MAQPTPSLPPDATPQERMKALLESLSAYIEHYHGGSVKLVSFDGCLPGLSALAGHVARLGGGHGASVLPRHPARRGRLAVRSPGCSSFTSTLQFGP